MSVLTKSRPILSIGAGLLEVTKPGLIKNQAPLPLRQDLSSHAA